MAPHSSRLFWLEALPNTNHFVFFCGTSPSGYRHGTSMGGFHVALAWVISAWFSTSKIRTSQLREGSELRGVILCQMTCWSMVVKVPVIY